MVNKPIHKKATYAEGDYLWVTLPSGLFGAGLIARAQPRHHAVLAYFFPKVFERVPRCDEVLQYTAADAILIGICSDLGLLDKEWQIVCHHPHWDRTLWPLPLFVKKDGLFTTQVFLAKYSETNLFASPKYYRATPEQVAGNPAEDGDMGSTYAINRLSALLEGGNDAAS